MNDDEVDEQRGKKKESEKKSAVQKKDGNREAFEAH